MRTWLSVVFGVALVQPNSAWATNKWSHGWTTSLDMTFADFNADKVLTPAQIASVNSK